MTGRRKAKGLAIVGMVTGALALILRDIDMFFFPLLAVSFACGIASFSTTISD